MAAGTVRYGWPVTDARHDEAARRAARAARRASEALLAALREPPHRLPPIALPRPAPTRSPTRTSSSRSTAATSCTTAGFRGVDERWEWEPSLLALRGALEARFEAALRDAGRPRAPPAAPEAMDVALRAIEDADDAPSLSRYVERDATLEQVLEFLVHRSAYQLKEADPHSWAIPRLSGAPKAALVEIQADEYGGGRPERIHAHAVRRRDGRARPRSPLRRLPRPPARPRRWPR